MRGGLNTAFAQPQLSAPQEGDITHNSITLRWTGGGTGNEAYVDHCRGGQTSNVGTTTCPNRLRLQRGVLLRPPFTVTNLSPTTPYYFRVALPAGIGADNPGNVRVYTTAAAPMPPVEMPDGGRNAEAVDDAVLPRLIPHGVPAGIYQRIKERQREDGRWK